MKSASRGFCCMPPRPGSRCRVGGFGWPVSFPPPVPVKFATNLLKSVLLSFDTAALITPRSLFISPVMVSDLKGPARMAFTCLSYSARADWIFMILETSFTLSM